MLAYILFFSKNMQFFTISHKGENEEGRVEKHYKEFMKQILAKIRHSSREIDRSFPLTKREYPPPRKRVSFDTDSCESDFFQNYIYRFGIEKINMKWYPALGGVFSPNTHLETSTIWYTYLKISTFFKKSMAFS